MAEQLILHSLGVLLEHLVRDQVFIQLSTGFNHPSQRGVIHGAWILLLSAGPVLLKFSNLVSLLLAIRCG